mgnify:CR=1 FL=1
MCDYSPCIQNWSWRANSEPFGRTFKSLCRILYCELTSIICRPSSAVEMLELDRTDIKNSADVKGLCGPEELVTVGDLVNRVDATDRINCRKFDVAVAKKWELRYIKVKEKSDPKEPCVLNANCNSELFCDHLYARAIEPGQVRYFFYWINRRVHALLVFVPRLLVYRMIRHFGSSMGSIGLPVSA